MKEGIGAAIYQVGGDGKQRPPPEAPAKAPAKKK